MELTTAQQFEIERLGRAIDSTRDPETLRGIARQMLQLWFQQKAATAWVMKQSLAAPPRVAVPERWCRDVL